MPPKKANNKKQQTKTASLDAEMLNNVKKELGGEESRDSKILTNGLEAMEEALKDITKAKATKRGSGRTKKAPTGDEELTSVGKEPAANGKSKKKIKEIEVIKNENEVKQEIKEEETEAEAVEDKVVDEEIITTPKGRSGSKKSKRDSKKTKSSKGSEESQNAKGNVQEQMLESNEFEKTEKQIKVTAGKRKKQDTPEKEIDNVVEIKPEVVDGPVEKASKKSRVTKKTAKTSLDVEPKKKRGKLNPKEEPHEKYQVEGFPSENNLNDTKTETKKEKSTKRGRNATKTAPEIEDDADGHKSETTEEVLPKKRLRKATNDKGIAAEKPKKGRGKKIEKAPDNGEEGPAGASLEKSDIATNGDIKEEKFENIEESLKPNKKNAKRSEQVDSSSKAEPTAKGRGGRKRAAPSTNKKSKTAVEDKMDNGEDNDIEDEADGDSKPSKTKKKKDSAPLNPTGTKYNKDDFELAPLSEGQTVEEPRYNLKISSWNVAGLRSWLKKEGLKFLEYEQPDIFCMQEIKCTTDQLPEEVERLPGYHPYWLCMPGGYAGVAIYSKIMPINVEYGIGNKEFDNCGRIITAEYEKFFLINVYVPNSGRKLVNLDARMKWEKIFQEFVQKLDARKPVVICGDMNVSHQEIDLANPKTNTRNAGFTKEERDKMTELLSLGYIDTFRHLYPDRKGAYTFWTYMGNARARNVGWRLDYFIVSERFIKRVIDNCIRNQCMGSDHCPITLFMKL